MIQNILRTRLKTVKEISMTSKLLNVYNDALLSGCVATAHIVTVNAYDFCNYPALKSDVCELI